MPTDILTELRTIRERVAAGANVIEVAGDLSQSAFNALIKGASSKDMAGDGGMAAWRLRWIDRAIAIEEAKRHD